ncbi:hydroxymethylglutaryl-CoA lyase [Caproicibacter fermentans]|uniref:Hydroxymethylglutaryl-CoA lyase n=1 Tax=Caproicibacter fermentans TaxID=2576756 RepID=A0A7G8T7N9_9FIRM|nr:hydroxymethylglutaryl-CoA lyase [Caproicibacter fermentans]QNK39630.1 hydroxymethylglutaryl-CoA lyase [Caproicibacter fermentans]
MSKVNVVEIGPRDGFQNVKEFIPTDVKLKIIDGVIAAGYKKVQITSFVSPKAIPQMKDASQLTEMVLGKYSNIDFFALVPNFYGARSAAAVGLKEITPVISLSETHNKNNVKRTKKESLEELRKIRQEFPDIKITQDIATVFGCPFEGEMKSVDPLLELIGEIHNIGIHAFTLCDTIGVAYPTLIQQVFQAVRKEFQDDEFNVHIHDTRNMGILNSLTAIQNGADSVQAAIGGLGGCPFAPGATGNTSSEDLVYMLNKCGYETGINFDKLLETAKYAKQNIHGNFSGHHINIPENPCVITQE